MEIDETVTNDLKRKALEFAVGKHENRINEKSIVHPMRVAKNFPNNPVLQSIAFLHEILEDTDTSVNDLVCEFGYDIANAVVALTRGEDEEYFSYIDRCKENKFAKEVKVYDLVDNMDMNRLPIITIKDAKRQMMYAKALCILLCE